MAKPSSPNPPGPNAEPPIVVFDGAITTFLLPAHQPNHTLAFSFKVTFNLSHPRLIALSAQKPLLQIYHSQEEYIQIIEGRLGVDIEGAGERVTEAGDGELLIRPWVYHRLFPVTRFGTRERGTGMEMEKSYQISSLIRALRSQEQCLLM